MIKLDACTQPSWFVYLAYLTRTHGLVDLGTFGLILAYTDIHLVTWNFFFSILCAQLLCIFRVVLNLSPSDGSTFNYWFLTVHSDFDYHYYHYYFRTFYSHWFDFHSWKKKLRDSFEHTLQVNLPGYLSFGFLGLPFANISGIQVNNSL